MTNPNNCAACKHKDYPDGGWCYMFRLEPTRVCAHHTGKKFNYPIYRSVVEKVVEEDVMTQQKTTYSGFSVGVVSKTEDDKPQSLSVSIMDNQSGMATSVSINYAKHLVTQLLMAIDFIETAKASEKKEEA